MCLQISSIAAMSVNIFCYFMANISNVKSMYKQYYYFIKRTSGSIIFKEYFNSESVLSPRRNSFLYKVQHHEGLIRIE